MASYSSSNTEPERWEKIVKGADSGRYPEIMIDEGKIVALSKPSDRAARIQSFLADVFKDGDNEWFSVASDSVEASKGAAVDDGQPEGSNKKKKVSLTKQREMARQEKNDQGLGPQRAVYSKDSHPPAEWARITSQVSIRKPPGVFLEGGKLVATDKTVAGAHQKLVEIVDWALGFDEKGRRSVRLKKGTTREDH